MPHCPRLDFAEWPTRDRLAWESACRAAGPLDQSGAALRWAEPTRALTVVAWGRYLGFLQMEGKIDPNAAPADRVTVELIGKFAMAMEAWLAPSTISMTLTFVVQALSVFAPGHSWSWIRKHPAAPKAREVRASRRDIVPPDSAELLNAAFSVCDGCLAKSATMGAAAMYRDAVLVALGACTALRRRNLTEMRLGVHLRVEVHGMRIVFDGTLKNHRVVDTPLSPMLAGYLDHYVSTYRPLLLGDAKDTGFVWLADGGEPLNYDQIYGVFQRMGRQLIGRKLSVHSVRYALATGMMIADPKNIDRASAALAHRDSAVTRRSYDRSGAAGSNRVWAKLVERKRRMRE